MKKSVPPKGKSPHVSKEAKLGANTKFSKGTKGRAYPSGCDKTIKSRGNPPH